MNYINIFLILFFFSSCGQQKSLNSTEFSCEEGQVNMYYDGEERLSGLIPICEGMEKSPTLNSMTGDLIKYTWENDVTASIQLDRKGDNILLTGTFPQEMSANPERFVGCFFKSIPHYKQGMSIWRYKPWNAWTKPVIVNNPDSLPDWDVQLFYWQYDDGVYGAAIPLNDKGYRTTIGREGEYFGAKSVAYAKTNENNLSQMLIGFGKDPYALLKSLYTDAMATMGCQENLIENKKYPELMEYLGWCTWNASEMGQHLDEKHIMAGVESFQDKKLPLGWVLIDDGWEDNTNQSLNSYTPDKRKFPDGFKEMNRKLREEYGLRGVGIWNAFDGHWKGINPNSKLGDSYRDKLFSWEQKGPLDVASETCYFIRPDTTDAMDTFYNDWLFYEQEQGFNFVKVDNQLVVERMAVNNYPIDYLSKRMHQAMYNAIFKHMDGAVINCMSMTAECYYNFGKSAVGRAVEDYFPEKSGGVGYNMERGGAAAHLIMALYNNLYFSQMVYTDFDMFESYNANAVIHAFTRALNNGPIYITDNIGQQNTEVLRPLTYSDGKLIRTLTPLTLTEDCLFLGQGAKPMKAFSKNLFGAALCLWNMSDTDCVEGDFALSDIYQLEENKDGYVVYDYFAKKLMTSTKEERHSIRLNRMGYAMYHVLPIKTFCTPLGLVDKYNVTGTMLRQELSPEQVEVTVGDGGRFVAYAEAKPAKVLLDGTEIEFVYTDKQVQVLIPEYSKKRMEHIVTIIK